MASNPARGKYDLEIDAVVPSIRCTVNEGRRAVRSSPLQLNHAGGSNRRPLPPNCDGLVTIRSTCDAPPSRPSTAAPTSRPPPPRVSATAQSKLTSVAASGRSFSSTEQAKNSTASIKEQKRSLQLQFVRTNCSRELLDGDSEPSRVLHVSVQQFGWPITEEALWEVFSMTGKVQQVIILNSFPIVEALVQYMCSIPAMKAWDQFHGRPIYDEGGVMNTHFSDLNWLQVSSQSGSNVSKGRSALPGGFPSSAYQDPRVVFAGSKSPVPWTNIPFSDDEAEKSVVAPDVETEEVAADLLEVKWSTNVASNHHKKDNVSSVPGDDESERGGQFQEDADNKLVKAEVADAELKSGKGVGILVELHSDSIGCRKLPEVDNQVLQGLEQIDQQLLEGHLGQMGHVTTMMQPAIGLGLSLTQVLLKFDRLSFGIKEFSGNNVSTGDALNLIESGSLEKNHRVVKNVVDLVKGKGVWFRGPNPGGTNQYLFYYPWKQDLVKFTLIAKMCFNIKRSYEAGMKCIRGISTRGIDSVDIVPDVSQFEQVCLKDGADDRGLTQHSNSDSMRHSLGGSEEPHEPLDGRYSMGIVSLPVVGLHHDLHGSSPGPARQTLSPTGQSPSATSLDSAPYVLGDGAYFPVGSPQKPKPKAVVPNVSLKLLHLVDSAIMGKPDSLQKLKHVVNSIENFGDGEEAEGIAFLVVDSLLAIMGGVESFEEDEDNNPPSVMLNSRAAIVARDLADRMTPRTRMVRGLLSILRACTRNRVMCSTAGLLKVRLRTAEKISVEEVGSKDQFRWDGSPLCHCIQYLAGHYVSLIDLHCWFQVITRILNSIWAPRLMIALEKAMGREEAADYEVAIKAQDKAGLMDLLTYEAVEKVVTRKVELEVKTYGNGVIQFIVEQKISSASPVLISEFEGNFWLEKCLAFCDEEMRSRDVQELLCASNFDQPLEDPHANYVIQAALRYTKGYLHSGWDDTLEPDKAMSLIVVEGKIREGMLIATVSYGVSPKATMNWFRGPNPGGTHIESLLTLLIVEGNDLHKGVECKDPG